MGNHDRVKKAQSLMAVELTFGTTSRISCSMTSIAHVYSLAAKLALTNTACIGVKMLSSNPLRLIRFVTGTMAS